MSGLGNIGDNKSRLGKGLDALLSGSNKDKNLDKASENDKETNTRFLSIHSLQRGQFQPRHDIDQESLNGLAESIVSQGIIEPIVVRPIGVNGYEIVAGERRWLAAQKAGLEEVPCIVRRMSDDDAMVIALLENIQREDLNVMEEAEAMASLCKHMSLTHEELAKKVGKSRSSVSNAIRLIELNEKVKELLKRGDLEMGHARALLSLSKDLQENVSLMVVQKGLTVRETESLVSKILNPLKPKEKKVDPEISEFTNSLTTKLNGLDFKYVKNGKEKGKLILSYKNNEEFLKIKHLFGI